MQFDASEIALVVAAVLLAGAGGECFLKGVVAVAHGLRFPKFLVATTLAAFATSSPELTVSTIAALTGKPEIGLGDALGSNVVNIGLIFGLALLFRPISTVQAEFGATFALALLAPLLTLWLAADGVLSRLEGGVLLLIFLTWVGISVYLGLKSRRLPNGLALGAPVDLAKTSLFLLGGLVALVFAGRLFVTGAAGIATALGVDDYVVGVTVVAIGTSLPELVTVILARLRGHDEVGVGTLIGSNLFNGLGIVGIAASIHSAQVAFAEIAVVLFMGSVVLLLLIPRNGVISRSRGGWLLVAYAIFIIATVEAV